MAAKRPCANCGRVLTIVAESCCYVCYHAGKGLTGTKKDEARAEVKKKIESGGLHRGGKSGSRKAAPAELKDNGDMMPHRVPIIPDPRGRTLQIPAGIPADIPVTIRLMIEVSVRVLPLAG